MDSALFSLFSFNSTVLSGDFHVSPNCSFPIPHLSLEIRGRPTPNFPSVVLDFWPFTPHAVEYCCAIILTAELTTAAIRKHLSILVSLINSPPLASHNERNFLTHLQGIFQYSVVRGIQTISCMHNFVLLFSGWKYPAS